MQPNSGATSDSDRSTLTRIALWGGGLLTGLFVLILVAALLIPQFFTSEELKGYVIPPMEEATGRQVEIDDIGLRVLWTPAVSLSGFQLANREGYGPEPAVEAGALNVEVALWPLLTGTIRPTAVELLNPLIRYEVAEDGTTNFDDLMASDTTQAEQEDGGLSIPVSNFHTTGAQVRYTDRSTGQSLQLDFDAQLSALPDGDALTSEGTIDVKALRAVLPSVRTDTLAVTEATITYDVRAVLSAGRLDLSTLTVETAPITLNTTGTVTRLNSRPTLDLTVETKEADLAQLAAFAPAASQQLSGLNPTGTLQFTTTIQGPLPDSTGATDSLTVDGSGRLSGIGVDYQGAALLRDLSADVALSLDRASVQSLQGQLLGRSLEGEVTVRDLMESPTVEGRLAGAANLEELASFAGGEGASESVSGTADYDVRFSGPLGNPDAIRPSGEIRLTKVRYPYESFRHPIEIPEATVQLTGTGLSMDRFTVQSGEQTMALETTVRNLFPISEGLAETNPALAVDVTATSERLDLVALYPEADTSGVSYSQLFAATLSGSSVKGQSPEAIAKEMYGSTELPGYAVDGRVEIATFLNDPQRIDDLAFDVQMRDRRLEVRNLSGTTYEGTLAGTITFDQSGSATTSALSETTDAVLLASRGSAAMPGRETLSSGRTERTAPPSSDLDYDIQLTDARAGAFLQDWTMLGRVVKGTLDLNMTGNTGLSEGLLPVASALTAKGTSVVVDGGLSLDLGVTKILADKLGLDTSSLTSFQRFGGPFTIKNGMLEMGTWELGGGATNARLTGGLGLGGSVDVMLRMDLPLSTLQQSKIPGLVGDGDGAISGLVKKLTGGGNGDTTIPVRIHIGGTMQEPTVEVVDKDAVRSAIQKLVREEGLDRVRNLFDGG